MVSDVKHDLPPEFFDRDPVTVARDLIGCIVRVGACEGRIVETEAYVDDAASHAVTRRNQAAVMRESFGRLYVYFIYGMHYCLNFTADSRGPGAVLIRALEPTRGLAVMARRRGTDDTLRLLRGPGCVCQGLGIDLRYNQRPIGRGLRVLERRAPVRVTAGPRIGISQAIELPWRYCEAGNPYVSRGPIAGATRTARRRRAPQGEVAR